MHANSKSKIQNPKRRTIPTRVPKGFWILCFELWVFSCGRFPSQPAPPEPPAGMALIGAAGKLFVMGDDNGSLDERPARIVAFTRDFFMDTAEVSQEIFSALMGFNPSSFPGDSARPVESVSWFDAILFCNAKSKAAGYDTAYSYSTIDGWEGNSCTGLAGLKIDLSKQAFRLPTEAEWEYACRAGSGSAYYWGGAIDGAYCWYDANSGNETHRPGAARPNAFGLYDMSGNLWEWCNDWYGPYDTMYTLDPAGIGTGAERVMRGGSWLTHASACRSANRNSCMPHYRSVDLGFRTVMTVQ